MYFNDDITIINHFIINDKDEYKINHIKANFVQSQGISINNIEIIKEDNAIVRILFSENGYVNPEKIDLKDKTWTLQEKDLIIPFIIAEKNINSLNEIIKKYKYYSIVKIKKNDKCSESMKHWKVEAK